MNLFEKMVDSVLAHSPHLASIKPVVEKELLHHDILRIMHAGGYLESLVFIGGTCLRMCYGSLRLSEDLDFSGGFDFNRNDMLLLGKELQAQLQEKYTLPVFVSEPQREEGNVSTWKVKLQTSPASKNLPAQRINIDICAIPSYAVAPAMLINHYPEDLGTSGVIVMCETLEEIHADKIIAFALRPNRIKNRDIWDLIWLKQKNIALDTVLIQKKLKDRAVSWEEFLVLMARRLDQMSDQQSDFNSEMSRFLPKSEATTLIDNKQFWPLVELTIKNHVDTISKSL